MMKSSSSESSSAGPWCNDHPGNQSTRFIAHCNLQHTDMTLCRHEKGWSCCQDYKLYLLFHIQMFGYTKLSQSLPSTNGPLWSCNVHYISRHKSKSAYENFKWNLTQVMCAQSRHNPVTDHSKIQCGWRWMKFCLNHYASCQQSTQIPNHVDTGRMKTISTLSTCNWAAASTLSKSFY